jgi:SsrA-binding protein
MEEKTIARNKKAFHNYHIEETIEAGLVLVGSEVKSIRAGSVSIKESYARIDKGEACLYNMHISPYEKGSAFNPEPKRNRKLLLKKKQIMKLLSKVREKGITLVPLRVYFKGKYVKVELGLAKGKRQYDKRRAEAEKSAKRDMERALKEKKRF